jgi:hypothetical protein
LKWLFLDNPLELDKLLGDGPELLSMVCGESIRHIVGLTDFLGGCKVEREHPTGGYHAKRTRAAPTPAQDIWADLLRGN